MRNIILSAAAALLLCAAPGLAAAQTGYAGVTATHVDTDGFDGEAYGIEGAVAFEGSGDISFELDAAAYDSDDSDALLSAVGHLFTRNDSYLFGGFVGVAHSDDSTGWVAGVEASKYFTDVTVSGVIGYGTNDDADTDAYGIGAQVAYFPDDNLRLSANLGWTNVDDGFADDDAVTAGVGAEYQFAQLPISLVGAYNRTDSDFGESDAFTLGLRYNWGGTLKERDRSGASQADIAGILLL